MISTRSISAAPAAAARYYAVGDYYTKGEDEPSEWRGAGAEHLGLGGEGAGNAAEATQTPIETKALEEILTGQLPPGNSAAWEKNANPDKPHMPGWDFTLSAPKSVSVAAILGGDERLIVAHRQAAREAMAFLERYAVTRVRQKGGGVEYLQTGNLVIASFTEHWSRAGEAQLHDHNVVANMTYDALADIFRALDGRALYEASRATGQIYQNSLGRQVGDLGFAVTWDQSKGTFEIGGVPQTIIDQNSTRSAQIDAFAKANDLEGHEGREKAALATRGNKEHGSNADFIAAGRKKAGDQINDLDALVRDARERAKFPRAPTDQIDQEKQASLVAKAMRFGLTNASASEAVVEEARIISDALQVGGPDIQLKDADAWLAAESGKGRVIASSEQTGGKRLYRGRIMKRDLTAEERYAFVLNKGKGMLKPILNDKTANRRLQYFRVKTKEKGEARSYRLSGEQVAAARAFLTSTNRIFHAEGVGGAGKSAMVGGIKQASRLRDHLAVAKTAVAAAGLGKDAGLRHMTVDKFLAGGGRDIGRGGILYVDEATMLGTRAAARIDALAAERHFRVAVIGDSKQLPAIEQGKPHELAGRLGAEIAALSTSRRHKTGAVVAAVEAARSGQIRKAVAAIDHVSVLEKKALPASVAAHWAGVKDRDQSRILVLDNPTRVAISEEARKLLVKEGTVDAAGTRTQIFSAHMMTEAQKKFAAFYPKGKAAITFHRGDNRLNIEKGATFDIKARGPDSLLLERRHPESAPKDAPVRLEWRPSRSALRGVSVYDVQDRDIARGDRIQWKRNQPDLGDLKNGAEGEVIGVDGDNATIRFKDGSVKTIDIARHPHWDHAYALTVYKAQGATYDRSIVVAPSQKSSLLNQKTFYTALSRARFGIELWTDDRDKLVRTLEASPGGKTSALEGTGRLSPNKGGALPPSEGKGSLAPLPPTLPISPGSRTDPAAHMIAGARAAGDRVRQNLPDSAPIGDLNRQIHGKSEAEKAEGRQKENKQQSKAARDTGAKAKDDQATRSDREIDETPSRGGGGLSL